MGITTAVCSRCNLNLKSLPRVQRAELMTDGSTRVCSYHIDCDMEQLRDMRIKTLEQHNAYRESRGEFLDFSNQLGERIYVNCPCHASMCIQESFCNGGSLLNCRIVGGQSKHLCHLDEGEELCINADCPSFRLSFRGIMHEDDDGTMSCTNCDPPCRYCQHEHKCPEPGCDEDLYLDCNGSSRCNYCDGYCSGCYSGEGLPDVPQRHYSTVEMPDGSYRYKASATGKFISAEKLVMGIYS